MTPGIIDPANTITPPHSNANPDAKSLESISDAIDTVNILKDQLPQPTTQQNASTCSSARFDSAKDKSKFRQYQQARSNVRSLYAEQHAKQTVAYNLQARRDFHSKTRAEMTVWDALEKLDTFVDDSDPDTSLSQIEHLLQTAEAMRRDGKPRWMQLVGLIHDLGKLLFFYGARGQWDVVGDTFPVGCAFDARIIYAETFRENPDYRDEVYSSEYGMYQPGCGLDNVLLSWGHDEYLYHVMKDQSRIPEEGLAMIRYHSFYPWHREGAYRWMMDEKDERMLEAVRAFNPYDLYSKSDEVPDVEELKEYYIDIIDEYIGKDRKLKW